MGVVRGILCVGWLGGILCVGVVRGYTVCGVVRGYIVCGGTFFCWGVSGTSHSASNLNWLCE